MEKVLWHCQNAIILKTRQIFFTAVVLEGISMRRRSVIKLFVYTAKSTEIRKWEPALKPHENRDDKTEL